MSAWSFQAVQQVTEIPQRIRRYIWMRLSLPAEERGLLLLLSVDQAQWLATGKADGCVCVCVCVCVCMRACVCMCVEDTVRILSLFESREILCVLNTNKSQSRRHWERNWDVCWCVWERKRERRSRCVCVYVCVCVCVCVCGGVCVWRADSLTDLICGSRPPVCYQRCPNGRCQSSCMPTGPHKHTHTHTHAQKPGSKSTGVPTHTHTHTHLITLSSAPTISFQFLPRSRL